MIIVLFGQPGSGKSTLAAKLSTVNVDGDKMRQLYKDHDYTKEGRIRNLNRASDVALFLHSMGKFVVVSMVHPYEEARQYLTRLHPHTIWVYLTYDGDRGKQHYHVPDFEEPAGCLTLDTSSLSVAECVTLIQDRIYEQTIL